MGFQSEQFMDISYLASSPGQRLSSFEWLRGLILGLLGLKTLPVRGSELENLNYTMDSSLEAADTNSQLQV